MSRYTYLSLFFIIVAISLFSSHVVYQQYKTSQLNAAMNYLSTQTSHNVRVFEDWLLSRQNEMRFVASNENTKNIDKKQIENLLVSTAELNGDYDTIFFVDLEGRGVVGVDYKNGQTRVMPRDEAQAFYVQDRDWFKSVREGRDTFSEPLISRASGKRVSTISVPIFKEDQFIGIMRGAVLLSNLMERVGDLQKAERGEVFLVDQRGNFVTPNQAMFEGKLQSQSEAAMAVRTKTNWTGTYLNDLGQEVIGSVVFIPILGWGLVYEVDKDAALQDVYETFKDLFILAVLSILFAVMVFSVFFRDPKEEMVNRLEVLEQYENSGKKLTQSKMSQRYATEQDGASDLIDKMAQTNLKLDKSIEVLEDINSRVNISTLELEQLAKQQGVQEAQPFGALIKDLRHVDTKLKKAETYTKGLLQEQSWLIEQLRKLFQKA